MEFWRLDVASVNDLAWLVKIGRMKRYFYDLDALHRFTLTLDSQPHPIQCQYCSQQGQFVSHGFVYKKHRHGERRTVGKRLFCSNRHGRSGCGRTLRLYLATELAFLHYTALHLTAFVRALLEGSAIQHAYRTATQTAEPRNAYRWLDRLQGKLVAYRARLKTPYPQPVGQFTAKNKQRHILLSTLRMLLSTLGESACAQIQQRTQTAFI